MICEYCLRIGPSADRFIGSLQHRELKMPDHEVSKQEADETVFWLECLARSGIVKPELLQDLIKEANELLAIFAASQRTARR